MEFFSRNIERAVMTGLEGATLRTVAVDATGKIIGVLQGDYAGTLKTLAVDDQGRTLAVLTDPEDVFGNPSSMGAGELAARLGSIKHYNKHGEVVFMDSFEDSTFKWNTDGKGTGWSAARSNERARTSDYSVKLITGSDSQTDYARIDHLMHNPVLGRIGCEYSFSLGTNLFYIYNALFLYDGTNEILADYWYNIYNDTLWITDDTGNQQVGSGLLLVEDDMLFHTWKQVVDFSTEKYVRLYLDNVEYDVSTYSLRKSANASRPHMKVRITAYTYTAANNYAYVDDVIVTQNEPA